MRAPTSPSRRATVLAIIVASGLGIAALPQLSFAQG